MPAMKYWEMIADKLKIVRLATILMTQVAAGRGPN
jgi:hypothetical protein